MRVLFVDQSGQLGGGELSLLEVIRSSSHSAQVVLFSDGPLRKMLEDLNVTVHLLSPGRSSHVRKKAELKQMFLAVPSFFRLRRRVFRLAAEFDVVYANSQKAFLVCALAKRKRQPLIWHLRDMVDANHFSPSLRRLMIAAANRSATCVITNSNATRDAFLRAGGRADKVSVVYNGIRSTPFESIDLSTSASRRESLKLHDKFLIGAFGRLTPWKGQHILIAALASLPDVHALIVGEALFGEQEYAASLRKLAVDSGCSDRVHFMGFQNDIPALMAMVDMTVHTATAPEPFGRVIVESMLACRPVVASAAGGPLEIVADGVDGVLIEPGSIAALSSAIAYLRSHPQVRNDLAARGRVTAQSRFTVEAMVSAVDGIIDQAGIAPVQDGETAPVPWLKRSLRGLRKSTALWFSRRSE